jgi:hypothetical protein
MPSGTGDKEVVGFREFGKQIVRGLFTARSIDESNLSGSYQQGSSELIPAYFLGTAYHAGSSFSLGLLPSTKGQLSSAIDATPAAAAARWLSRLALGDRQCSSSQPEEHLESFPHVGEDNSAVAANSTRRAFQSRFLT